MPGYILRTATYWHFELGPRVGLCRHQFCSYLKRRQASQKAEWSYSEINCLWKGQWYLQPLEPHQMDGLEMVIKPNLMCTSKQLWQWRQESLGPHQGTVECSAKISLGYIILAFDNYHVLKKPYFYCMWPGCYPFIPVSLESTRGIGM